LNIKKLDLSCEPETENYYIFLSEACAILGENYPQFKKRENIPVKYAGKREKMRVISVRDFSRIARFEYNMSLEELERKVEELNIHMRRFKNVASKKGNKR